MIEGSFKHEDSKGGGGMLTSGTVQWMTAGKGIYHSEMPGQTEGSLWGYQLWLSLPAKDKFAPPRYQHLAAEDIPRVKQGGLEARLVAGAFGGKEGPAKTWFPIDYFDVRLGKDDVFEHTKESDASTFLYVHSGKVTVETPDGGDDVNRGGLALFDDKTRVRVKGAGPDSGFLYISGRPNNEPIVRGGPFVMNTKEQLIEAFEDWQNGTKAD
jgi:redox-sensitive bicupin YhaK (pirin superfamily)